jgi:acyl-CoA reductase-like NAD-dependent aldehyde dehydrogenase
MVQGVVVENGVIQNINPATGQLIEPAVNVTSPEELENIISAANASQPSWSDKTLSERIEAIRQGLIAVEPIGDELASVITKEMGKVSAEAKLEVSNAIGLKDGWLDMVREANEDVHLGGGEEGKAESVVVRDPLGVVVVISPWNVSASISSKLDIHNILLLSCLTNLNLFQTTECLL